MKVTINRRDVDEVKKLLGAIQKNARPAISRAQNKALTGTRTDMTRIVTRELNITAKEVRDPIKIKKSSVASLIAFVRRTGKPMPLSKFTGTRQVKSGVSVKVKKTGARATLKHGFLATMKSGHLGAFWRQRKPGGGMVRRNFPYGRLPRPYRLPLEELTGPRIEDILAKEKNWAELRELSGDRLFKELSHEVDRIFKGEVG